MRDALGPYLTIYLLTERNWDAASIGVVMSIATIAGILAQAPAGAVVDATKAKRAVMVATVKPLCWAARQNSCIEQVWAPSRRSNQIGP